MDALRVGIALLLTLCAAAPAVAHPAFPYPAAAQGAQTGILRGRIVDAQDLPVPGATVTVTSPALQGERSTVTGPDGSFVLRLLPAGTYQVKSELTGFGPQTQTVVVPLGDTVEHNVTLRPENVTSTVEVTAAPPPLI